jgi:mannose/fructose-specific phosphotransferase system component IIA
MNGETSSTGITGIVVTHGKLAEELVRTAKLIVGEQSDLHAISGSDFCDDDVVRRIRDIIADRGDRQVLLFVDFFGGSCCINSVRAVEGEEGVKVVSGVNLPMLLSFATKRDLLSYEQLVDHLIRRGRESITVIDL